jgi:hypothetical protein
MSRPEVGLADTEPCCASVRYGVHLVTGREKVVPCGAAAMIDLQGSQTCVASLGRDADSDGFL